MNHKPCPVRQPAPLAPCPFCGGQAARNLLIPGTGCRDCGARGPVRLRTGQVIIAGYEADAAWNTRTGAPSATPENPA